MDKPWVQKAFDIYKKSMEKFLKENSEEIHTTQNIGKSLFTESFIRALKSKIYKYMTSIPKNVQNMIPQVR